MLNLLDQVAWIDRFPQNGTVVSHRLRRTHKFDSEATL